MSTPTRKQIEMVIDALAEKGYLSDEMVTDRAHFARMVTRTKQYIEGQGRRGRVGYRPSSEGGNTNSLTAGDRT